MPRLPTELELPDNTHAREMSSDMMEEESSHHSKASDSSVGMKDMMSENRVKERQYSFVTSRGRHSSPGHILHFFPLTWLSISIPSNYYCYRI